MTPGSSRTPTGTATHSAEPSRARLGVVALVALVAALAVVLASGPARQFEVWSHLARGRALVEGRPQPARDPGLFSPADEGNAHTAALYDLSLYAAYASLGGAGVTALNAGLAGALAVVAFLTGRTAGRATPGCIGTLLTLVGVAPWFGITPRLPSYLFLALLVLLLRNVRSVAPGAGTGRAGWPVPVLIAVWANVDRWVVLGPLTVGLFAAGELFRGRGRVARSLGGVFLAALGASLLSPNHVTVWNPAHTLGWEAPGPSLSPFWPAWYRSGPPAVSAAYAVLVVFGLVAFRRDPEARTWAPLWVVLLAAGAVWPVAAPFFAVVAGPVCAFGLSVVGPPPADAPRKRRRVLRLARGGAGLLPPVAAAALLVAAWPGWVVGPPYGRPEWVLDTDDSLRDAVQEVARWRGLGLFGPDECGLTLSPEVADYWSWFAHGSRAAGTERSGGLDFATVRAGLLGEPVPKGRAANDWRGILRARSVSHLILHSGGDAPTEQVATQLAGAPDEWVLLYLRGRTAVFGWRDPEARSASDRYAAARVSIEHRAFVPGANDRAPLSVTSAETGNRQWARAFREPPPAQPQDQAEAAYYLAQFDGSRAVYDARNRTKWLASQNASLLGMLAAPLPAPGPVAAPIGQWAVGVPGDYATFAAAQDDGPLGALVLAVRAARRAVQASPEDAKSYFLLGEAYLRLAQATRERVWRYQLPVFDRIRQLQAITAYQQCVALRPDSPAAHGRLARLYRTHGTLDLALHHLDALVKLTEARGTRPGAPPGPAQEALSTLRQERDALATDVQQREATCETGKGNRRVLDQAREAVRLGLTGLAIRTLLASDASEFGPEGVRLELELLLWAGRAGDVRAWLDPGLETSLGVATFQEIRACLATVEGNYQEAGQALHRVADSIVQVPSRLSTPRTQASYDVVRAVLAAPLVGNPCTSTHTFFVRQALALEIQQITTSLRREANVLVVTGLLALEAGQIEEAESLFRAVLARAEPENGEVRAGGIDFSGRVVAEECLYLIATARQGHGPLG
ncbi:hypothetical protein FTUN_8296 [Frigoriglobus tundricola]|uniref:Tetratricopeptide repeat protein n=2 Tax=Frigoriglobus tundricola TaxID=2774151 RepID=A0A6M5Z5E4_9BACT|nr:hypothetical protein FTUN_8296 [Frigoriglobus tundricola]